LEKACIRKRDDRVLRAEITALVPGDEAVISFLKEVQTEKVLANRC
jgi:hypothetical protein